LTVYPKHASSSWRESKKPTPVIPPASAAKTTQLLATHFPTTRADSSFITEPAPLGAPALPTCSAGAYSIYQYTENAAIVKEQTEILAELL
jgi:hypothetical protein